MDSLFLAAVVEQPVVLGESVELLSQPMCRHQSRAIAELSLSKDKRENRDEQIDIRDPE